MYILFLSSANPKLSHETSSSKILAELLENIVGLGHQVSWATVNPARPLDEQTRLYLKNIGIQYIGDFSNEAEVERRSPSKYLHFLREIRKCLIPLNRDDFPHFSKPEETFKQLKESGADVFLLFLDTWFENLLPHITDFPVVAYEGKARYAAPKARLKSGFGGNKVRRWLLYRLCRHRKKRHLQRARFLTKLANICAVDAAEYRAQGIPCKYIQNTWPDAFGQSWRKKRNVAERTCSKLNILANIGNLSATGNTFGLLFLADEVLPSLEKALKGIDWEINICGGGEFSSDVREHLKARLSYPRVNIKGFVPDIDKEMLSNAVFLLLNNAGPYIGGYTRVVYMFSSGGCLVAHRRLADSMPEVRHGVNALLGETGEEIAKLVARAAKDPDLRARIGKNARETYEKEYHPKVVAKALIKLAKEALAAKR